jgi:alpha-glucoside transport system substrate-binding protein
MGGSQPARVFRRRTLLAASAGLLTGCTAVARTAGLGDFVRIAVSWSATELAAFRSVLAGRNTDDYELIPLGDDIDAALGASTAGRPDMVALPRPGYVTSDLEPLPNDVWQSEYDRIWRGDLPTADHKHYALPFKLAHKSVVWYRKKLFTERNLKPPSTWDEWLTLTRAIAETGTAPLALGGADGWMLGGWFENVLLRNFTGTFDALGGPHDAKLWQHNDIRATFGMLADIWGQPGALPGGPERALVQQFPDAVLEVFKYSRAAMVVAPDFAESVIRRFGVPSDEVGTFTFPARTTAPSPIVVAGDLLVLTRPASEKALDLIRYLAKPEAPAPWIKQTGGFIAANPQTDLDIYGQTPLRRLAEEVRDNNIRFDLSDRLGAVGGREGLQRVLQDFLQALGNGTEPERAAGTAMNGMVAVDS